MDDLKPIYFPNEENIDKDLFYPILSAASSCRCMTGYLTSGVLRELSSSIAHFLKFRNGCIKFIIGPQLPAEDVRALEKSIDADESLLPLLFPGFDLNEDYLRTKSVEALSYLVATKKIEIKVALKASGIFHSKVWLFEVPSGNIVIHGSGNATGSGMACNFEQINVSKDYNGNPEGEQIVRALSDRFESIWSNDYPGIKTYGITKKTINELINVYERLRAESIDESTISEKLYREISDGEEKENVGLTVPKWLNYTTGDYAHQGEAILSWQKNNYRGILSIATGGGKTLTSLTAATLVQNIESSLLVVISVPTKLLLAQWSGDVAEFGTEPLVGLDMSSSDLSRLIKTSVRNIKSGYSKSEVVIITHEALKNEKIINSLSRASSECPVMLIGDEVHNLGSAGFQSVAPDVFKYKLGLSATVERQFDDCGTEFLYDYFGPIVYEFSVSDAIGKCLVGFNYHVHEVELLEDEQDEWLDLTYKIKKLSYASELTNGDPAKDRLDMLRIKRRKVIEGALGKVVKLREILPKDNNSLSRALVFCTEKNPAQLDAVNKLFVDRGVRFHQVTQEETRDRKKLQVIINLFSTDIIRVLTSKRVLNEGFNVPQTEVAYLLANSTVERQWVQRLGRILRKSDSTGKTTAVIHDFIVTPKNDSDSRNDPDFKSLVRSEVSRIQFFNGLSMNGLEENGAMDIIDKLMLSMEDL